MSERFPDVGWYCDSCDAELNDQPGFDDHKYTWKCTACGHKSSISRDNIVDEDDAHATIEHVVSSIEGDTSPERVGSPQWGRSSARCGSRAKIEVTLTRHGTGPVNAQRSDRDQQ